MPNESANRNVRLGAVQLDLIWCPPGQFIMGCSEDEEGDAEDAQLHTVTLTRGFWLGKCPVTQAEYDALAEQAALPPNPSKFQGDRNPVERVTWFNAADWCKALNRHEQEAGRLPDGYEYRLPTEAEWEYACRAGTTTALNNGKTLTSGDGACPNLDEVAWYKENSGASTHEVGTKKPNNWGICDMHGNVEEWCCDWYDEYPPEAVIDPAGPGEGRYHVCRGGNLGSMAMACSSSARKSGNPTNRRNYRGFRLALAPIIKMDFSTVSEAQPRAVQNAQMSPEEIAQMKQEMEERFGVNRPYEDAISGDESLAGSRSFTMEEPGLRMIWCPAGSFTMGSPDTEAGRNDDERPHRVTLTRGFWMGMYPITQEDYAAIADAADLRSRPSNFAGLRRPVESVDYDTIMRWCRELTYLEFISGRIPDGYEYRLPTEAEWEYACRAGTTTIFNRVSEDDSSDDTRQQFDEIAWYKYNSGYKAHVVGERKPNNWGLCDMHGNIREWCLDWYGEYQDNAVDPVGPATGEERVIRGGCFGDYPRHCRSAYRTSIMPAAAKANIGFRVVLAPIIRSTGAVTIPEKGEIE